MVATTQLIIDWITGLGWDDQQEAGFPLLPGPLILDEPDQVVFITVTGGPGFQTDEQGIEAISFQARVRGPSDDPLTPEAAARSLDQLIRLAPLPSQVDGAMISNAYRLGGAPAPLPVDPADLRHEFTASYIIVTGA